MNLCPFYEKVIREKMKCTSLRLGDQLRKYNTGAQLRITIGWSENDNNPLIARGKITSVKLKKIKEITKEDLEGESPDCRHKEQIIYVLSAIYRKVVSEEDCVTIVSWKYLD